MGDRARGLPGDLSVSFFFVDCVLWVATKAWSHPVANANREYLQAHPDSEFHIEEINVVDHMMSGDYQIYRHVALFVLIVAFDVLSFSAVCRAFISGNVARVSGLTQEAVDDRLPAVALLVYVLACEGSMWFMRARAAMSLHILRDLRSRFTLHPRTKPRKPSHRRRRGGV